MHMLVVFSPGRIEGLFRAAAGVDDVDKIAAHCRPLWDAADRTAAPRKGSFDLLAPEVQRSLTRVGSR